MFIVKHKTGKRKKGFLSFQRKLETTHEQYCFEVAVNDIFM